MIRVSIALFRRLSEAGGNIAGVRAVFPLFITVGQKNSAAMGARAGGLGLSIKLFRM